MDFSIGWIDCLISHNCPLLSPEEVLEKLKKNVQVEECSHLLAFNTNLSFLKFNLPAFSIKVPPSIFQLVMDTVLVDTDFSITYFDVILIENKSYEDEKHVKRVFEKVENANLS